LCTAHYLGIRELKKRNVVIALSALCCSSVIHADIENVTLAQLGAGSYQNVAVKGANNWNAVSGDEIFYNLRTFEHEWVFNDGASEDSSFITHCVEIYQGVTVGAEYMYDVVAIENVPERPNGGWPGNMGEERARLLRDLYAGWANPNTGGVNGSASDRDAIASAFQLMVWEITHENFEAVLAEDMVSQISFELGAIQRKFVGAGQDMVGDYVTQMTASLSDGPLEFADLVGWTEESAQDQARFIPAPGVLLAMAGGLAIFGRRRRF
jgi:hypothetical protein